jgi:hypothetical protein
MKYAIQKKLVLEMGQIDKLRGIINHSRKYGFFNVCSKEPYFFREP